MLAPFEASLHALIPAPEIPMALMLTQYMSRGLESDRQRARAEGIHHSHHEALHGAFWEGIPVEFPHRKNHHIAYPFSIHSEYDMPLDYHLTRDRFYIQLKTCHKLPVSKGSVCNDCQTLTSIPLYISIMDHIQNGVCENMLLVYHGVRGLVEVAWCKTEQVRQLQLMKLNAS
jgi:hypothetical protein